MTAPENPAHVAAWRRVIKRHPLVSFFVLACGLSWLAWVPYVFSMHGLGLEPIELPNALVAQLALMLPGAYLGPIFSAYLVTVVADGRQGVRLWLGRALKWRVNWRWYALSLLGIPALMIICAVPFSGGDMRLPSLMVLVVYVPLLIMQVLTTGLAEEPGWRDFALPRIQPYFGPLLGTIILGVIWGIWHLPMFLTEWAGYPDVTWVEPVVFTFVCIAISIVMTWVFNRTGESLPIAILLHASVNTMASAVIADMFPAITSHADATEILLLGFGVIAVVIIVATKGKLGYDPASATGPRPAEAATQSGQGTGTGAQV